MDELGVALPDELCALVARPPDVEGGAISPTCARRRAATASRGAGTGSGGTATPALRLRAAGAEAAPAPARAEMTAAFPALALGAPTEVTLDGIGGARPGMSFAQVASSWGVNLELRRWRAAWFTRGVHTPSGIRIGSTLATLKRTYGARLTRVHALYARGVWLYYLRRTHAPHWMLRFDVSAAGRVQSIGFGESDPVTAQEGCA